MINDNMEQQLDSAKFRDAMANLCAAVNIVTTNGKAGKAGLTVSAMCSVTDTPPTVLICINQQSDLHDVIAENGVVCINILNEQQVELAKHFACMLCSTMEERLAWDVWQEGLFGLPVLENAVANLQGKIVDQKAVGTHTVFFIELVSVSLSEQNALVYFDRQFKCVGKK